jgi:hypothetical protein
MLYNPFKWNYIKILSNPVRSATHRYLAEFKCAPKTAGAETVHDSITLLADHETVHDSITLLADPQAVTTGFKTIDLARPILITKNANNVAGNVKLYGTDILGRAITETITLPTNATIIESTKAFKSVTKADLPAYTTEGDWIKIGTPQTVTTGFKTIDLARPILLTKKSNSVAGNVKLYGTDILGRSITETISLPTGATTIESTKAFKSVTKADLPAYTSEGDWIKIGTVNKIGLPALFYEDRIVLTIFDKAQIAHTGTYSKSDIALNILAPTSATFNDTKELIVIFIPCYEEEA